MESSFSKDPKRVLTWIQENLTPEQTPKGLMQAEYSKKRKVSNKASSSSSKSRTPISSNYDETYADISNFDDTIDSTFGRKHVDIRNAIKNKRSKQLNLTSHIDGFNAERPILSSDFDDETILQEEKNKVKNLRKRKLVKRKRSLLKASKREKVPILQSESDQSSLLQNITNADSSANLTVEKVGFEGRRKLMPKRKSVKFNIDSVIQHLNEGIHSKEPQLLQPPETFSSSTSSIVAGNSAQQSNATDLIKAIVTPRKSLRMLHDRAAEGLKLPERNVQNRSLPLPPAPSSCLIPLSAHSTTSSMIPTVTLVRMMGTEETSSVPNTPASQLTNQNNLNENSSLSLSKENTTSSSAADAISVHAPLTEYTENNNEMSAETRESGVLKNKEHNSLNVDSALGQELDVSRTSSGNTIASYNKNSPELPKAKSFQKGIRKSPALTIASANSRNYSDVIDQSSLVVRYERTPTLLSSLNLKQTEDTAAREPTLVNLDKFKNIFQCRKTPPTTHVTNIDGDSSTLIPALSIADQSKSASGSPPKAKAVPSKQLTMREFLKRLADGNVPSTSQQEKPLSALIDLYAKKKSSPNLPKHKPKMKEQTKGKSEKYTLDIKMNRKIVQHFALNKVTKDVMDVFQKASEKWFAQFFQDISIILNAEKTDTITHKHMYLLMKQLKIVNSSHELHAMMQEHLPGDQWQKVIPIMYQFNNIHPKVDNEFCD